MRPGIKEFDKFIRDDLAIKLRDSYTRFEILSEADLQALAWHLIREFLNEFSSKSKFKVLNKPYFKDLRIHPDLAIFRKDKPWVLIELKESIQLRERTAKKERERLLRVKKKTKAKRGYLVYVARWGKERVLRGPKGKGAKYFFEVPITLEKVHPESWVDAWEEQFRREAKYILRKR